MSRAVRVAVGSVALAMVPGALTWVGESHDLERAPEVTVGRVASPVAPPLSVEQPEPVPVALPVMVAPPPPETPEAVPITPPPADLTGELAPAGSSPTLFQPTVPVTGEVLALVVGIDDYPGSGFDLSAAVDDADTIDAALAGFGVPPENRVVLRDGQARRPQLVAALQALVARAGPGSTVVLAYAGHVLKLGPDTEAIVAADGGLLTDQELADLLAPAQASRMWVLLATCFAGGFTELLAPGRILTGATDADSLAYESPDLNASFLVHHLIRGAWLEGRAGPSVQEAFTYADARLGSEGDRARPQQIDHLGSPLVLGDGDPTTAWHGAPRPVHHTPAAQVTAAGPPPPLAPTPTSTTVPAKPPERTCLLGVLLCRQR